MADTIGDLIDKLTIANIRIWHLEDTRRMYNGDKNISKAEFDVIMEKTSLSNRERNDLVDQINACFRVLFDKTNDKESTIKLSASDILGNGKNKYYKVEDS